MKYIKTKLILIFCIMCALHNTEAQQWCPAAENPLCPPLGAPGSGNPPDCENRQGCLSQMTQFGSNNCNPIIIKEDTGFSGFVMVDCNGQPGYITYPKMKIYKLDQHYNWGKCAYSDASPDCCSNKSQTNYTQKVMDAEEDFLYECLEFITNQVCQPGYPT